MLVRKAPGVPIPPLRGKSILKCKPLCASRKQLSGHCIDTVVDDGGKPCATTIIEQRCDAKILLNEVSVFGDGLVAGDLGFSKRSVNIVFAHNAIGNFIEGEKSSFRFAGVAFISTNHFDILIGVHAIDSGIRQIG